MSERERILRTLQEDIIARRDQPGLSRQQRDTMADQANVIDELLAEREFVQATALAALEAAMDGPEALTGAKTEALMTIRDATR